MIRGGHGRHIGQVGLVRATRGTVRPISDYQFPVTETSVWERREIGACVLTCRSR